MYKIVEYVVFLFFVVFFYNLCVLCLKWILEKNVRRDNVVKVLGVNMFFMMVVGLLLFYIFFDYYMYCYFFVLFCIRCVVGKFLFDFCGNEFD